MFDTLAVLESDYCFGGGAGCLPGSASRWTKYEARNVPDVLNLRGAFLLVKHAVAGLAQAGALRRNTLEGAPTLFVGDRGTTLGPVVLKFARPLLGVVAKNP